jgi:hypothetical protein
VGEGRRTQQTGVCTLSLSSLSSSVMGYSAVPRWHAINVAVLTDDEVKSHK